MRKNVLIYASHHRCRGWLFDKVNITRYRRDYIKKDQGKNENTFGVVVTTGSICRHENDGKIIFPVDDVIKRRAPRPALGMICVDV